MAEAAAADQLAFPLVSELIGYLRSPSAEERSDALLGLLDLCDAAYGEDGRSLGRAMRAENGNALSALAWLLADPEEVVRQQVLLVIGNLCSDSVDSDSLWTKRMLLNCASERSFFACLDSQDEDTIMFACGALQNLCHDRMWSELVNSHQVNKRLEQLVGHSNAQVVRYAAGALKNVSVTLKTEVSGGAKEAIAERSREAELENFRYR